MKTFYLHLIRHGQTDGNKQGLYIGSTDLPLNTEGIEELEMLRDEDTYPKVGMVYASPMLRCIQSANIIYPGKDIHPVEELREYDFGDFEGKSAMELDGRQLYADWTSGKTAAPPNGEDPKDFVERICVGLNQIVMHLSQSEFCEAAVVLHGGVIMSLLGAAGLPQRPMVEWASGNGKGYTIRITPSLYGKSGVFEVVGEIPETGAGVVFGF